MSSQNEAEIISIGTELLRGEITDTNAGYLASELPFLGIDLVRITAVRDNKEQLRQVLQQAMERSALILASGGLGPTEDDITRECIAAVLGEELAVDAELEKQLRAIFARLAREMPASNIKQAMLIPSARPLPNPHGTAPGWWIEKDRRIMVALPGPPRELKPMWHNEVKPHLQSRLPGEPILSRTLKTFGLSEAKVAELATPFFDSSNPSLGIYAHPNGIHLRLIARGTNSRGLLRSAEEQLEELLAGHIWGKDKDSLEGVIGRWLSATGLTLATMEDGTGGLLAEILTGDAGSAGYYLGGLVACSDEAKVTWGVPAELIKRCGAVSAEIAEAMAALAREQLSADIGLSTTGFMGLEGLAEKRSGLVYIGLADSEGSRSWQQSYLPHRDEAKHRASFAALFRLRQRLIDLKIAVP